MKSGVLILECLDEADPGSEGQFLLHMFKLMGVDAQYVEVRTKRQLLALLDRPPFRLVHITTHGRIDERRPGRKPRFCGLWSPTSDLTTADLGRLKDKLVKRSVISTACMSGAKGFARQFVKTTGCVHYIAPQKSPTYSTAIYFSHLLYHKYFELANKHKQNIPKIVGDYNKKYKNVAAFHVTR